MRNLTASSPLRERRIKDADEAYEAYLARGFSTAPFPGQLAAETLQCRNELDRTNWLALLAMCDAQQRAADLSGDPTLMDAPIPVPIRATSNRMYVVSYADAKARMFVLLGQAAAAQANWWRLKDECRAAPTWQALEAVDMTEGWP